ATTASHARFDSCVERGGVRAARNILARLGTRSLQDSAARGLRPSCPSGVHAKSLRVRDTAVSRARRWTGQAGPSRTRHRKSSRCKRQSKLSNNETKGSRNNAEKVCGLRNRLRARRQLRRSERAGAEK